MRIPGRGRSRRGIAGIIGAVFLFVMLFTVGTGYFIFVNDANTLYAKTLNGNIGNSASRLNEYLAVTTFTTPNGNIGFYLNNTGGVTTNVTAAFLLDSTGSVVTYQSKLMCWGVGVPSTCTSGAPYPLIINVGRGTTGIPSTRTYVDTGFPPTGGATYTLKVLTARGSSFSASYPPTATALAAQALSSGAIGDLYLQPNTYTYYKVVACGENYCLQKQGYAFTISTSFATSNNIAFSVTVNDLNPTHLNVTLDAYTVLTDFFTPHGSSSSSKNFGLFIVSNVSTTIQDTYTLITLQYNKPVTLVFASGSAINFQPFTVGSSVISPPDVALIFILTHGCKGIKASNCNSNTYNYGQNSPYVSTEYT